MIAKPHMPGIYFEKVIKPRFVRKEFFTLHVYHRGTANRAFRISPDLELGWKLIHFIPEDGKETIEENNDGLKRIEILYNKILETFDITIG